jgi:hypothetical protein
MVERPSEAMTRRVLLRHLAAAVVGGAVGLAADQAGAATSPLPAIDPWSDGANSTLNELGKTIIKDKNPEYQNPGRFGGGELAWVAHVQNDRNPTTWTFRGEPRKVIRSMRVPYHVLDRGRIVTEHVLIGHESWSDTEAEQPRINASPPPDDRWKDVTSSPFTPALNEFASDAECLGWLVIYDGNPLFNSTITGEYEVTGNVMGAKPNVARAGNWRKRIITDRTKGVMWSFRGRPTRVEGAIRILYRATPAASETWYLVSLLVGYEGGGAI